MVLVFFYTPHTNFYLKKKIFFITFFFFLYFFSLGKADVSREVYYDANNVRRDVVTYKPPELDKEDNFSSIFFSILSVNMQFGNFRGRRY